MLKFSRLFRSELIKIISRPIIYIMIGVLLLATLGYGYIYKGNNSYHEMDFEYWEKNGALSLEKYQEKWKTYFKREISLAQDELNRYNKDKTASSPFHTSGELYEAFEKMNSQPERYDIKTYLTVAISGLQYALDNEILSIDWRRFPLALVAADEARLVGIKNRNAENTKTINDWKKEAPEIKNSRKEWETTSKELSAALKELEKGTEEYKQLSAELTEGEKNYKEMEKMLVEGDKLSIQLQNEIEKNNQDNITVKAEIETLWNLIRTDDWKAYLNLESNHELFKPVINEWNYEEANNLEELRLTNEFREKYDFKPEYPANFPEGIWYYTEPTWQDAEFENYKAILHRTITRQDPNGNQITEKELPKYQAQLDLIEYKIQNDLEPLSQASAPMFIGNTQALVALITLLIVILAGMQIASEYSSGTIKILLISPHRRWKILLAKFLVLLFAGLVLLILLLLFSFLTGSIFYGFSGYRSVAMTIFGENRAVPYIGFVLLKYLLKIPELLVVVSMAVMFSVVLRHNAVAIGAGALMVFGNAIITNMMTFFPHDFKRYLLPVNLNLGAYIPSLGASDVFGDIATPLLPDMTLGFSLGVMAVYFIVFSYIAFDSFYRRDIK